MAAIRSILAQTYGDFDFLISDNASIDSTEEICRACVKRDASIRYMRRSKDAAANYNLLARMADSPSAPTSLLCRAPSPMPIEKWVSSTDLPGSITRGSGNWNDEAPAGGAIVRLLPQHLAGKIPDQQQDEVRLGLEQPIGRHDGYLLSRHEFPLLVRIGVDGVVEESGPQI